MWKIAQWKKFSLQIKLASCCLILTTGRSIKPDDTLVTGCAFTPFSSKKLKSGGYTTKSISWMPSNRWLLQGNLHMQPRLPDNRYFKITKSWPPSPWSPPPSPPSTQSRPSWLDHDDHHNCQLPHDHHRRHAQAQRSGCAKQQGSGQTKSPTARKKVRFLINVTTYMQ